MRKKECSISAHTLPDGQRKEEHLFWETLSHSRAFHIQAVPADSPAGSYRLLLARTETSHPGASGLFHCCMLQRAAVNAWKIEAFLHRMGQKRRFPAGYSLHFHPDNAGGGHLNKNVYICFKTISVNRSGVVCPHTLFPIAFSFPLFP